MQENALEEPHYAEIYEQSHCHHLPDKGVLDETSQQVKPSEVVFKEKTDNSFGMINRSFVLYYRSAFCEKFHQTPHFSASYLTNELKKLHPEDLAAIKRDIQNILERNTLVDTVCEAFE